MTDTHRLAVIVCAVLVAACSPEQPDPSAAARTVAQTPTAPPPQVTATISTIPTAVESSPTVPAATPTSPQPSATPQPTDTQQRTPTAPPATTPAATKPTTPEATPADTIAAPTVTVTQADDILTTLPEFTLPEIGPFAPTVYDPQGLLSMRGFSPFIPLDNPLPVPADAATWLRPDDFVLGVKRGTEARAYPISQVEYHHIVNDSIAGEPYLVTY